MSSRGDRRLPPVILMGAIVWATLSVSAGDATAQGYEPPGAPRMSAGGSHSDPGGNPVMGGSATGGSATGGSVTGGSATGGSATGTTQTPEQAAKELVAAAKAGDSEAQRKLALALLAIKPPKTDEAFKLLNQSADKGNAGAMVNIGQMFAGGVGVVKSEQLGATWYRRAADKGNAEGQNALGRLYETGQGVPQDFAEALRWVSGLAADQNNASGQNNLGNLYATGRGVPTNPVEAVRLFRLSADQGNAFAQANLGFRYASGVGVAPSPSASYFWLNLAVARLPANMTPLRDQVARARDASAAKVVPAELTRMQQMAGAWQPGSTNVPTGIETGGVPGRVQTAGVAVPAAPAVPGAGRNTGTGFVITQSGFVLTNNHVAGACTEVRARHGADDLGKLSVVAKDIQNDLALLKLPSRFPDAAVFREDRGLRQGDNVVTYGFPLTNVLAVQGNLTTGTISALSGLGSDSRMLQISAPVQPGNSGGPLLDSGGNVIGVVSMKLNALRTAAATGDIPQNVNFAIKAGVARGFLDSNGVDYRTTSEPRELKTADVGDRAKKFTLFIECLR